MHEIVIQLLPPLLASTLYAVLGLYFWKTRWSVALDHPAHRMTPGWEGSAIALAVLIHTVALYQGIFGADSMMRFSFSQALSLTMLLAVLLYSLESRFAPIDSLHALVLPLSALCTALPDFFPQAHEISYAETQGFQVHFLAAMSAYGLLTLSALHALLMGIADRALHRHIGHPLLRNIPPLLTLEHLLFRMVWLGFLLLTVAVGSGIFFSEWLWDRPLFFNHKTLFALLSWAIFATLLVGRHYRGWRGRTARYWTLAGFCMLMLAYVGSRFVVEILLGRV